MTRPVCLLLVMLPALAGCFSSPPTRFFVLDPVGGGPVESAVRGAPIAIGTVSLPPALDRLEIVRQPAANRLEVSDRDRWGAALDEMTGRVLAQDLARRLPPGLVLPPDAGAPPEGSRVLSLYLAAFGTGTGGQVRLEGEWTLTDPASSRVLLRRSERIEAGPGATSAAEAAGMSRALGLLADRIAAALAALPAGGGPGKRAKAH